MIRTINNFESSMHICVTQQGMQLINRQMGIFNFYRGPMTNGEERTYRKELIHVKLLPALLILLCKQPSYNDVLSIVMADVFAKPIHKSNFCIKQDL